MVEAAWNILTRRLNVSAPSCLIFASFFASRLVTEMKILCAKDYHNPYNVT